MFTKKCQLVRIIDDIGRSNNSIFSWKYNRDHMVGLIMLMGATGCDKSKLINAITWITSSAFSGTILSVSNVSVIIFTLFTIMTGWPFLIRSRSSTRPGIRRRRRRRETKKSSATFIGFLTQQNTRVDETLWLTADWRPLHHRLGFYRL